ncbi:MAG TPA: hypothetical protein VKY92_22210 [Verrucomicrobiae bacterium]|jgi:hypothetical protein|nr:hypothetical protein [Verrucomicrobiae bacterium]
MGTWTGERPFVDPVVSHETALVSMNKLFAILLLLGALASFGLSQRATLKAQETGTRGQPIGEPRMVPATRVDKIFFVGFGAACMVGCVFFVAKIRKEDLS